MNNSIEKTIELKAPQSRVWRALTDYREFGQWFCVILDGPFEANQTNTGTLNVPGYERLQWRIQVETIQPESLFSFRWNPYAVDPAVDYSSETPTLVEFKLESSESGTRLTVVESGFEGLPEHRKLEAFRMNEGGWGAQMKNIERYVTDNP